MENTLGNIQIESRYPIIEITDLKIQVQPNAHGTAEVKGIIAEDHVQEIIAARQEPVKIKEKDQLLFSGVIDTVSLQHINGMYYLTINAVTHSIKLDIALQRRSFQNKTGSYQEIFNTIIRADVDGDYIDKLSQDQAQDRFILQYDETNWTFLKRIASQLGGVIVPDLLGDTPRVYIGLPKLEQIELSAAENESAIVLEKDLLQYNQASRHYKAESNLAGLTRYIDTSQNYKIGMKTTIDYRTWVIVAKEIVNRQSRIMKRYKLKIQDGLHTTAEHNPHFTGLALNGTILAVAGDKVKIHLAIDQHQPLAEACEFSMSTFYSSGGQTGLYLMPQTGDNVQLYLPSSDENQAYVRSVNRQDGATNPKTQDVDSKYLGTVYGKEIKLAPQEISIINDSGQNIAITMSDTGGVEIKSNQAINVSSGHIEFNGATLKMTAQESIIGIANGSSKRLDNITHFKAERITLKGPNKS